jgi:hypothetical protein
LLVVLTPGSSVARQAITVSSLNKLRVFCDVMS